MFFLGGLYEEPVYFVEDAFDYMRACSFNGMRARHDEDDLFVVD